MDYQRNDGQPMKKYKAICSKCKKECEVPFQPTEGRDVFCKDCYVKKPSQNRY